MENLAINDFFENLLRISPDFITAGVVIICATLFVVSLFFKWRDISPALMISAGIIGTFWGTFIALADFETGADHKAMVESIPAVLGGMKTAFVTSLIGLFSAFFSKIVFHALPKPKSEPLPIESDTLGLLQEIKDSIAGEKDGSLSSQLKKLDGHMDGLAETIRTSLVSNMNSLIKQLQDVIGKQLVKQLEETNKVLSQKLEEMLKRIEDALLNEFGETFKQFNQATQAIQAWQEEHKGHVEQVTEAFKTTATGITKIRTECESIPPTMDQLKKLMGELDKHLKELDERLKAFAEMKDKAVQSFPVIHENLDTIVANLKNSAKGFDGLERIISDTYTNSSRLAQEHIDNIKTHMNQTADQVKKVSEKMIAETDVASTKHQTEIREIMNKISEASERCRHETEANLKTMREIYIKDINEAMAGIARSWGENMVGIAKKWRISSIPIITARDRYVNTPLYAY